MRAAQAELSARMGLMALKVRPARVGPVMPGRPSAALEAEAQREEPQGKHGENRSRPGGIFDQCADCAPVGPAIVDECR